MTTPSTFASFADFYPDYLRAHQNRTGRRLHFYFERNRTATFSHPLYSLVGDFRRCAEMWTGKIPL